MIFWATWCPSCQQEMMQLREREALYTKQGIKVILVNVGESAEEVKYFQSRIRLPIDILLDEDSRVAEQYGIIGYPTVFTINKNGVIINMDTELPQNFAEILSSSKGS